jgi:hypothetical protein
MNLSMYIDTSAVGSESGPVGETNVAMLIGVPDDFDSCTLQNQGKTSDLVTCNFGVIVFTHGIRLRT